VPRTSSAGILADAIRAARLSQAEVARAAGLSADHLSRILSGRVPFPRRRDTLQRLAIALGIPARSFGEYRELEAALSPPARQFSDLLDQAGLTDDDLIGKVPRLDPAWIRQLLRGARPFPQDRPTLEALAGGVGLSPVELPGYAPSADWRAPLLAVAQTRLDAADFGVFRHLLDKVLADLPKEP
jgi:transcriptional regulator with XRE-family HTH domain